MIDSFEVELRLFNRQRAVLLDLARLLVLAKAACVVSLPYRGACKAVIPELDALEISIVSDRVITRIHRRFLNAPGPTDVITFDHGEIIVSATTAARQAAMENEELSREVARYIVHGILHLNGYLDHRAEDAAAMWQAQEELLQALWPSTAAR